VAAYIKQVRPQVKIIGVEPNDSNALFQSLHAGRRVTLPSVGLFADGVAVKRVGEKSFRLCREFVDEVLLVHTDAICAAIKDVFEETRTVLEPAGALAVAGVKRYVERGHATGKTLIAITSGANMNFDRLRFVAEEAELGERREALFGVTIPEKPGSFKTFCRLIGTRSITEFNYRYADPREAHVFVGVQIKNPDERARLLKVFRGHGLKVVDLTDNDLAKTHIRYLVGGRAPQVRDERLYRFEFPERPGALMNFLTRVGGRWNISLFHYRNQGADYGRVLAGIQVPPSELHAFSKALQQIGYLYSEETLNPAYRLFL
jgi:threonine dehydratase